jgi:hypothetical protein
MWFSGVGRRRRGLISIVRPEQKITKIYLQHHNLLKPIAVGLPDRSKDFLISIEIFLIRHGARKSLGSEYSKNIQPGYLFMSALRYGGFLQNVFAGIPFLHALLSESSSALSRSSKLP